MYKIPANTLFIGKNVVFVPQCHSTNDLALQLSQQSATSEGTVVITNHQVGGRGQRGNVWEAQKGLNFTFSLIVKPKFLAVPDQYYLNIFTSLAIVDYLRDKTDAVVQIKWPNDILVEGKKLCGILIENQIQGNRFSNSIIGIGLNMNQKDFGIPTATSLSLVTGKDFKLSNEHESLLLKLEARYLQLHQQDYKSLITDYLSTLYRLNEEHVYSSGGVEFTGVITGIDEGGRLKVKTEGGERFFGIKEIIYGHPKDF